MSYELNSTDLTSRRGMYNTIVLPSNPIRWAPPVFDPTVTIDFARRITVREEVLYAQQGRLAAHKYWANESLTWITAYEQFYTTLFSLDWINHNDDRHNLVVSAECCLTLVQYHNHKLIAYSRSTDMKNGFHSDKLILEYLAEQITKFRPDCQVTMIEWYLAVPHIYKRPGIARLLERTKENDSLH